MGCTFAEKNDMEEYLEQIPNYAPGLVQRVCASDAESACNIVAHMTSELLQKWYTSVLCISLDLQKDAFESLVDKGKSFARHFVIDQKNPDCWVIVGKAQGHIHRKFVRAVIISGAERLVVKGSKDSAEEQEARIDRMLSGLAQNENVPVILVETTGSGPQAV